MEADVSQILRFEFDQALEFACREDEFDREWMAAMLRRLVNAAVEQGRRQEREELTSHRA